MPRMGDSTIARAVPPAKNNHERLSLDLEALELCNDYEYCHTCRQPFVVCGRSSDKPVERATRTIEDNGGDWRAAWSIAGGLCLGCLVKKINPCHEFNLWVWRFDAEESKCVGEVPLLLLPGIVPSMHIGQEFELLAQGQSVIIVDDTFPIGYLPRSIAKRLSVEIEAGIVWKATVNERIRRNRDEYIQKLQVLVNAGLIPSLSSIRTRVRLTAEDNPQFLSAEERWWVLERDEFTCVYCGRMAFEGKRLLVPDHIIPRSRGGGNNSENLVTACNECNRGKGSGLLTTALLERVQKLVAERTRKKLADEPPSLIGKVSGSTVVYTF